MALIREFFKLKKLWPYLRTQKKLIGVAILLIPLISILQVSFPLVLKYTIDRGIVGKDLSRLAWGASLYLGIVLIEYLVRAAQAIASSLAVHRMIRDLRMKLTAHILSLKCSFHDRSMSGALVTRATGDFDNLSEALNLGVLTSVVDISVLIGCIVGMFLLDWRLALLSCIILPVVWVIVQWFSAGLRKSMLRARVEIAALNGFTQEALLGNATIKLLSGEETAERRYHFFNERYRKAQMGSVVLDAMMFSVLDGMSSVTVGLVLWLAAQQSGISEAKSLGQAVTAGLLVAFVQYVQQLFEPLKQLGNKIAMLQGAFTAIERIFGILENHEKIIGDEMAPLLKGEVEFKDVSYSYHNDSQAQKILQKLSFKLRSGTSLAIVGPTGSGKSTIIKLLTKLYDGYEGSISLDGQELSALEPSSLRRQIAIVPQDIVLFDGDLLFNLTLGDTSITKDHVLTTLKDLGMDDFVASLPQGLASPIREQGSNFSHGQRQLIAFARAMVKNPGLVILDEATSSVDPKSEEQLQNAIHKLLFHRSVIVIAHRLSTIRQCDQILVLDKGKIAEIGTHTELMAKKGAYYHLHGLTA